MPSLLTRTLASSLLAAVALACLPARGEDAQLSRWRASGSSLAAGGIGPRAAGAPGAGRARRGGAVAPRPGWARDGPRRDALLPRVQVCVQELPQSALCHSALALLNSAAVFAQGRARRAAVDGIARLFTRAVELDRATSSCAATLATSTSSPRRCTAAAWA
jgi:hypothetical protein